jgi:hypothetical protein
MKKIDLTGEVYGRLTVISDDGSRTNTGRVLWLCECSCGNKVHVQSQNLKNGRTKSCGCLNDEKKRERFKDLSGTETDNFKIIDRAYSKDQRVWWNCICKHCGQSVILNNNLIGHQTSCGCRRGATKDYMDSIRIPRVENLRNQLQKVRLACEASISISERKDIRYSSTWIRSRSI